jgi:hypothetical protein
MRARHPKTRRQLVAGTLPRHHVPTAPRHAAARRRHGRLAVIQAWALLQRKQTPRVDDEDQFRDPAGYCNVARLRRFARLFFLAAR